MPKGGPQALLLYRDTRECLRKATHALSPIAVPKIFVIGPLAPGCRLEVGTAANWASWHLLLGQIRGGNPGSRALDSMGPLLADVSAL